MDWTSFDFNLCNLKTILFKVIDINIKISAHFNLWFVDSVGVFFNEYILLFHAVTLPVNLIEREMNFLYTHIRKRVIHHYYAEYIACQCMPSHRPGSHMAINLCTYTLPLQINLLFSALAYNHVTFTDCWQGISDGYK